MTINEQIKNIEKEVISWRRYFHQHAELSFKEYNTSKKIREILQTFNNIEIISPTETSVVGILKGKNSGKTVALRADIDALPMTELNDFDFVSEDTSAMHSCGHDGHTAIMLGTAKILSENIDKLCGKVLFIFQHAEELPPGGAIEMYNAGVMNGVDEIYGLHLTTLFPTGTFGVKSGVLTSATDRFDIKIIGKGGHSSMPDLSIDPIVTGAQVICGLQNILSRKIKPLETAVLSICRVITGDFSDKSINSSDSSEFKCADGYNIIPNHMMITGSVRTFSKELRDKMPDLIENTVNGITLSNNASYEFKYQLGYDSVINDDDLTENAKKVITKTFGKESILDIDPIMPGEDFSAFTKDCPGCFIELGAKNSQKGCDISHHNPRYVMDEDALINGVGLFTSIVLDRLK